MSQKPLAGQRILVTNDDGIHAPGLAVSVAIAESLSDDVWVVAPDKDQSGTGHAMTVTAPLRLRDEGAQRFAVTGTPTDCVIMAMGHVLKDKKPDLIISGVNRGMNIADDVTYSGTIGAAIEGTLFDVPSLALSQMTKPGEEVQWSTALEQGKELLPKLIAAGWPKDILLNINFPPVPVSDVAGVKVCRQGHQKVNALSIEERLDRRMQPYYWIAFGFRTLEPDENTDMWALKNNCVSVTPIQLEMTHEESLKALEAAVS